jgi:L-asparagine permease
LLFLVGVMVLMCDENYWNLIAIFVIGPMLVIGGYAVRDTVMAMAAQRLGYTGDYPVVPQRPIPEQPQLRHRDHDKGATTRVQ